MEELQDEVEILLDFLAEDESVHEELVEQLSETWQDDDQLRDDASLIRTLWP